MRKIKVLHIVHNFLRGGIESFLYYTVKQQLLNPDLEVGILCCASKEEVVNHRIESLDVPIYYIGTKSFEWRIDRLNKIVDICNQYDIVHFQVFIPSICSYVQWKSKSKVVHTGHSAGTVLRDKGALHKIKERIFITCLNHSAGIAHNSPFTKKYWLEKGVYDRPTNISIYNGVNFCDEYDMNEPLNVFPVLKDKFIIGTTSRMISWKRVDYLIKAFAKAVNSLPSNAMLLIVGEGPELKKLQDLAKSLSCSDKIVFAGYRSNVTDYQAIMDVCVFPSAEEPFGLVSVECMHLGKRVLVMADGGGLVDIVGGYKKDFVSVDIDNLSAKLIEYSRIKTDGEENLRISYSQQFGINIEEQEYFNFYKKVLS